MAANEPSKDSVDAAPEASVDKTEVTVNLRIGSGENTPTPSPANDVTDVMAAGTDLTHVAGIVPSPAAEAGSSVKSLAEKLIDLGIVTWADWVSATKQCSENSGLPELLFHLEKQPARWASSLDKSRTAVTSFQTNRIFEGKADELRVENYVLLDSLGSGGMGEVFLARNLNVPRLEALKMTRLFEGDESTETQRRTYLRFNREKQLLAELVHPGIPIIFHAGIVRGNAFIAMELVRGKTFREMLDENIGKPNAFPQDDVLRWIIDVAKVLGFAHSRNVIHRDVKPANIMLTDNGEIKVLDLGIARLFSEEGKFGGAGITSSGLTLGTPEYMSPEQWADPTDVTPATDIYSLGCVMCYLLTGKPPYASDSRKGLMLAHVNELAPDVCKIRAELPRALNKVVRRMLEKEPGDRYQSAEELVKDLSDILAGSTPTIRDVGMAAQLYSDSERSRPFRGKEKTANQIWLVTGLVMVVMVAVGFGIVQWQKNNELTQAKVSSRDRQDPKDDSKTIDGVGGTKTVPPINGVKENRPATEHKESTKPSGNQLAEENKKQANPGKENAATTPNQPTYEQISAPLGNWLTGFAQENASVWRDVGELDRFAKAWFQDNPKATADTLKAEVVRQTAQKLKSLTQDWLTQFQNTNQDVWRDKPEFDAKFAALLKDDGAINAAKLKELQALVQKETEQYRNPFANVRIAKSNDPDLDHRKRFFVSLFQQLSAATVSAPDASQFDVQAVNSDGKPVSQIAVKQQVNFVASTSKPGYVTALIIPNTGSVFANNRNKRLEPGSKKVLLSTSIDEPRSVTCLFFLTDFNPLDKAPKPEDGQFAFEDGPTPDFLGRSVIHQLDDVEHQALRIAFGGAEVYDRILSALQSNRPHPLSARAPVGKRLAFKLVEVRATGGR